MDKKVKIISQIPLYDVIHFCAGFIGTLEALKFVSKTYIRSMTALVTTLTLKERDTSLDVIIDWMIKNPRALLETFDMSQSSDLDSYNLYCLIDMICFTFPQLKTLNIQMCQSVFALPTIATTVSYKIKIAGCLELCSTPDVYNHFIPSEFVLTHIAMIKHGYNDNDLFLRSDMWLKYMIIYEKLHSENTDAVIKVMSIKFRPKVILRGKIFSHGTCAVIVKHNEDLLKWKLKKTAEGFWRTFHIDDVL